MTNITWCVAHTHPLKEGVAKQHLLEQGYAVYLPQFKKTRRHARKVEEVLKPLFPRYLFIGIDIENTQWRRLNSTRGISYLLMNNDITPARISTQLINQLKAQEVSNEIVSVASLIHFTKKDKVRILEGAFKDQVAVFEAFDDKARVQLLLNFMGREMKVTLPTDAVEAA